MRAVEGAEYDMSGVSAKWTKAFRAGRLTLGTAGRLWVDRARLLVQVAARMAVMFCEHNGAEHPGWDKLVSEMGRKWIWFGMRGDAADYVAFCQGCRLNKTVRDAKQGFTILFDVKGPLEVISVDVMDRLPQTPHGYQYVLTIMCMWSRWLVSVPLRDTKKGTVARPFWTIDFGVTDGHVRC